MITFPNAKINLGLSVISKRQDGFFNIETVFYPIPLKDALEIIIAPDNKFEFTLSGFSVQGNTAGNICYKAWKLLKDDFNLPPVKMHLHKAIPMGAGLGGGSADAAFTLKLLNGVFELKLSNDKLKNYTRKLGSDCSFFLENKTVFAYEKGDMFQTVALNLKGYFIIIVKPAVHVNTADAYAGIVPGNKNRSPREIVEMPVTDWKNNLFNDFEKTIFTKHPEIKNIKDRLYKLGAIYASMSGSGSAIFGIFDNKIVQGNYFGDNFCWSGWL